MNDVTHWILERLPVGEDLDRPRLSDLATEVAGERSLWEHVVHHDPSERYFAQLYRDAHVDVWLICWLNQQDTGYPTMTSGPTPSSSQTACWPRTGSTSTAARSAR
jgi:hypothetical protein